MHKQYLQFYIHDTIWRYLPNIISFPSVMNVIMYITYTELHWHHWTPLNANITLLVITFLKRYGHIGKHHPFSAIYIYRKMILHFCASSELLISFTPNPSIISELYLKRCVAHAVQSSFQIDNPALYWAIIEVCAGSYCSLFPAIVSNCCNHHEQEVSAWSQWKCNS